MRYCARLFSTIARHRTSLQLGSLRPSTANDVFIAPNATVVGDVTLADEVSVWYGAVVRGDLSSVNIGLVSNVGEKVVINNVRSVGSGFPPKVDIGDYVTIGAGTSLRSCTISSHVLVGTGCTILDGALVESNVMLASGSVVEAGVRIPSGESWAGNPAIFISKLSDDEQRGIKAIAEATAVRASACAAEYLPGPDAP